MTWIPDGSSWKWIHLIFDQDLLQWVANSVTSGQSYKHFSLINYDSRVALSENCLYYNLRVVIYECKIFYRIHFQIGRNFGNKIKAFINSWRVYFVLGKILNLLWQKKLCFWTHVHYRKLPIIGKNIQLSGHTGCQWPETHSTPKRFCCKKLPDKFTV